MFLAASPRLLLSSSRRRPVTGEMKDSSSFLSSRVISPCLMPGGGFALIHGVHAPGRLRQMLIALNVGHQRPAEAGGSVCQSSAKNNPLRGNGRGLQAAWGPSLDWPGGGDEAGAANLTLGGRDDPLSCRMPSPSSVTVGNVLTPRPAFSCDVIRVRR